MKKIRIKVKHILVVFLLVIFVVPNIFALYGFHKINQYMKDINGIPSYVHYDGYSYRLSESDKIDESAVGLLQSLAEVPTLVYSKGEIYNKLGNCYYDVDINKVYIWENNATYGALTNREGINKAIEYFEMGVALGEESKYYEQNFKSLVNCYFILGEREKVVSLIDKSLSSEKKWVNQLGRITKAVLLGKEGHYEEALAICSEDTENITGLKVYLNLLIMAGKTNEHDEFVRKVHREKFDNEYDDEEIYYIFYDYQGFPKAFNELDFHLSSAHPIMSREGGNGVFKGRVTVNGAGVPYTLVYLRDSAEEERVLDFRPTGKDVYYGYTDKDGYFEIGGVNSGRYRVNTEASSINFGSKNILSNNKGFHEVIIEDNTVERELEIN